MIRSNESRQTRTDPRVLMLDPRDNVLTLTASVEPGDRIRIGDDTVVVERSLGLGHKLAARAIAVGEKIVKYGVAIGSASAPIEAGQHVHTHNLKSDYLPTYLHRTQIDYFRHPSPDR